MTDFIDLTKTPLPIELVSKILYKYKGLCHPIVKILKKEQIAYLLQMGEGLSPETHPFYSNGKLRQRYYDSWNHSLATASSDDIFTEYNIRNRQWFWSSSIKVNLIRKYDEEDTYEYLREDYPWN